jgi:hypothetical protein
MTHVVTHASFENGSQRGDGKIWDATGGVHVRATISLQSSAFGTIIVSSTPENLIFFPFKERLVLLARLISY